MVNSDRNRLQKHSGKVYRRTRLCGVNRYSMEYLEKRAKVFLDGDKYVGMAVKTNKISISMRWG